MDGHARGNKLDIPVSYDDPYQDAVAVKSQLDLELKEEASAIKKNAPSEIRWPASPPISTRAATPDWQQRVPRSYSGGSESSVKASYPEKRTSAKLRYAVPQDEQDSLADRPWPSVNTAVLDNPFLFEDTHEEVFDLLSTKSDADIVDILKRLMQARPTLRSVIKSATSQ